VNKRWYDAVLELCDRGVCQNFAPKDSDLT